MQDFLLLLRWFLDSESTKNASMTARNILKDWIFSGPIDAIANAKLWLQEIPALHSYFHLNAHHAAIYSPKVLILSCQIKTVMAIHCRTLSLKTAAASSVFTLLLLSISVAGRPATFLQDFRITWSDSHINQLHGGTAIQLVLDQNSGDLLEAKL